MRRKAVVASSELEGPGQVDEPGRGPGGVQAEQGLDRKFLRKGSLTHADRMGTSQQLSSGPRKGDALDLTGGRDMMSPRTLPVRPSSTYGSTGPPVAPPHHTHARGLSRPSPAAPFANMLSPRGSYQSSSYRDAALAAAQHGLSAYAASATAVAAAARGHQARTGGGGGAGAAAAAAAAATSSPGRPPPAPRPTQHSAPTPIGCLPNGAEFLNSYSPAPASRGAVVVPPSRGGGGFLGSRCSAPPPSSPCRVAATAAAASGGGGVSGGGGDAGAAAMPTHRSFGDAATVTVTHTDSWWRSAFGDGTTSAAAAGAAAAGAAAAEQDDSPGSCPVGRPPSGTANAIRVMSPGWGTASPSVYEADGRPGTRGGGPLYDMDGRPTTRGGQRPMSRAQLGLTGSQPRLTAHVAPLVGPGWAGLFAGGCATGPGEAVSASAGPSASASAYTSPRAPSAGTNFRWSGDGAGEPPSGAPRRQHLSPLPHAVQPGAASRLASPPARSLGSGAPLGNPVGSGSLLSSLTSSSSLAPSAGQPVGLSPPSAAIAAAATSHSPGRGSASTGQLTAGGSTGSSTSSSSGGGAVSSTSGGTAVASTLAVASGRPQLGMKLTSIAEGPNPPLVLPLPPSLQVQQQSPKGAAAAAAVAAAAAGTVRSAEGRVSGAGPGSGAGRKAPREREGFFSDAARDLTGPRGPSYSTGGLDEAATDDSYRADLDQDGNSRGGPGPARLRRSSSNSNTHTHTNTHTHSQMWQTHLPGGATGTDLRTHHMDRNSHGGETTAAAAAAGGR